jgi:hypothetical protein
MKRVIVAPSGRKRSLFYCWLAGVVRSGFLAFGKNLLRKPPLLTTPPSFQTRFTRLNPFACASGTEGGVVSTVPFPARTALSLVLADGTGFDASQPARILLLLRSVKSLILGSTTASFQSSGCAFGSVPPEGPNRTELLVKEKYFQEVQVHFL